MARTLSVSPEQRRTLPTIRDALEAAADGDVISIAPGEYAEALAIRRRHVVLTAREPGTVTITSPFRDQATLSVEAGRVEVRSGTDGTP